MVLPEVLALPFVQRAYVAALLVGFLLPTIGSFVVPKRLSLLGDTSAHVAFGAAAFASLIGIAFTDALAVPMTALATVLMLLNPTETALNTERNRTEKAVKFYRRRRGKDAQRSGDWDLCPPATAGRS